MIDVAYLYVDFEQEVGGPQLWFWDCEYCNEAEDGYPTEVKARQAGEAHDCGK